MAVRIVRLGSPRAKGEGLRIGTVRRPPRGVRKGEFGKRDFYDVWLPEVAPSQALVTRMMASRGDAVAWRRFADSYRREMSAGPAARTLDLLAELSKTSAFSVGCYCDNEAHCHRSVLRELLRERGARIA
jgi:uncharacterized protein YeaO (DUF488 family)